MVVRGALHIYHTSLSSTHRRNDVLILLIVLIILVVIIILVVFIILTVFIILLY